VVWWVDREPIWLFGPALTDGFVGGESAKCLEASAVVVGLHEQLEVRPERVVGGVVIPADGGLLERAVHALDLTVGPRMVGLGEPVLG